MTLQRHLYTTLPHDCIWSKAEETYAVIQGDSFRLVYSIVGKELHIRYLRVTEQGKRFGDIIVRSIVAYCRENGLVPHAIMPEEKFKHFWLRNDFQPTLDDDEKWVHEDWVV